MGSLPVSISLLVVLLFTLSTSITQFPTSAPTSNPTQTAAIQDYGNACPRHNFLTEVEVGCIIFPQAEINSPKLSVRLRSLVDYSLQYDNNSIEVTIAPSPPLIPEFVSIQNSFDPKFANILVGVGVDGVPIYSAVDGNGMDLVPSSSIDQCGGMYGDTPNGWRYHYRTIPACIYNRLDYADQRKQRINDVHELLSIYEPTTLGITPQIIIGYSITGYPIYSPFNNRGILESNLDNCNGKVVNGSYGYYATPVFPYIIGCDGPGVLSTEELSLTLEGLVNTANPRFKACPGGFYPSTSSISPIAFTTTTTTTNGCLPCPAGRYSAASYATPNGPACHLTAPVGHYSPAGSTKPLKCPGGRYGAAEGLGDSTCSGECQQGYFCPAGSIKMNSYVCGNESYYCPAGASVKSAVDKGYYTVPEGASSVTVRTAQLPCGPGTYCNKGIRSPCAPGRYGRDFNSYNASCSAACPIGKYCEIGSLIPVDCPAGRYGDIEGLSTSLCTGACQPGYWCAAGSTSATQSICAAGRYGAEPGLTTADCSPDCEQMGAPNSTSSLGSRFCEVRSCAAGYVCPAGSMSATQLPCGDSSVYCPPHSVFPTPVVTGYYTVGAVSKPLQLQNLADATTRYSQVQCEPGYYCVSGVRYACPAGLFGMTYGLTASNCSGLCAPGYICPVASVSSTQMPCGSDPSVYCPEGSYQPIVVPAGYYSVNGTASTMSSVAACLAGMYCMDGVQRPCAAGRYSAHGSATADCDGLCSAGYYCLLMSSSATEYPCAAGRYGIKGMSDSSCSGACLRGYYCPQASTTAYQVECGGEYVYCPYGSAAPLSVSRYHYSTGGNSTTRFNQSLCVESHTLGTPPAGPVRLNICPSTTIWT